MQNADPKATIDRIFIEDAWRANRSETDGQRWLTVDMEAQTVSVHGIDQPAATLVKIEGHVLTIKVPGHSYWAGLHMPRSYARSEFQVYSIREKTVEADTLVKLRSQFLTSFPVRS